jgi:hypothetical protein
LRNRCRPRGRNRHAILHVRDRACGKNEASANFFAP